MENLTPRRTQTALYWLAWSLMECDGLPLELIASRLGKSPGEILELLLVHPGRSHTASGMRTTTVTPALSRAL